MDLDGFPDLLMTLYNSTSDPAEGGETHLLQNTPCGPYTGCQSFFRQFQVQPGYTLGVGRAITSAFFDLYEDGKMDLLVVEADEEQGGYTVSAYTNTTQDSDAYLIKVIVLSGSCYHKCAHHSSDYVPYGTNTQLEEPEARARDIRVLPVSSRADAPDKSLLPWSSLHHIRARACT